MSHHLKVYSKVGDQLVQKAKAKIRATQKNAWKDLVLFAIIVLAAL